MESKHRQLQAIFDLVEICARKGINQAVLAPGSRCAPLLIGFGRHPEIKAVSMVDERSAAYFALGLAQESRSPVAIVSTSGTAAVNFFPAITEAWHQQVPLIVLTADRPPEWIDQWDGQTIQQRNLYGLFVKEGFDFPVDHIHPDARWHGQRIVNEAINLALTPPQGPVHVNIPLREPFYPDEQTLPTFRNDVQIMNVCEGKKRLTDSQWQELESELSSFEKILLVVGQQPFDPRFVDGLNRVSQRYGIPVVADVISNCTSVKNSIQCADLVFNLLDKADSPQLLITFGRSLVSKPLKIYLRNNPPREHWHIGPLMPGDVFQALTRVVDTSPDLFLKRWAESGTVRVEPSVYSQTLRNLAEKRLQQLESCLTSFTPFNTFRAVRAVMETLPDQSILHLGNSLPVRVVNILGIGNREVEVWSNRGTSGIDGTLSTALGHAHVASGCLHTLLIGDLAFFYDRNGLWRQEPLPPNLRIVLINNGGGGIFRIIPGPADQKGMESFFTTPHTRTGELTANEFGLEYTRVETLEALTTALETFFVPAEHPKLLEITIDMEVDQQMYQYLLSQ